MKNKHLVLGALLTVSLLSFKSTNKNELAKLNRGTFAHCFTLSSNDGYTVDEFYKKVELDYGTLDESGNAIDFIFVKTSIDAGDYEIELTDGPGDLYEIKGTKLYITFNAYFGYAGYGTECILRVQGGYSSSTVYKIE